MQIKDFATVKAYHHERIERFGADACEALGWKNQSSQEKRFAEFLKLGDFSNSSVLDLGCGHGDLFAVLDEKFANINYTGFDQSEAFLEVALQRFGRNRNARFLRGDFATTQLPVADYVICCGALNYRSTNPGYVFEMIARMFASCRLGLGVSLLSAVDFADGILAAYSPQAVLGFCQQLASRVELHEDYGCDDFMVFLYRESLDKQAGS